MPAGHEREVQGDERPDQRGQQKDVPHVHPRLEGGLSRERAAPDQLRQVRAHERDRHRDAVSDREPHAREEIVDHRVAEVALEQRRAEHREADVVGELARLAEGTREEDPEEVERDRRNEDVGRPMVRLADQQAGLDLERDVDRGLVRPAHPRAP